MLAVALFFVCADSGSAIDSLRTLRQAYFSALNTSERMFLSDAAIRESEAQNRKIFGNAFPALSLRHQTLWKEASLTETDGMMRLAITDLTGYKEYLAFHAGGSALAVREFEKLRAKQLLLQDVAYAFFGLLQAKENTQATGRLLHSAEERLVQLRERVRVGRSRQTDAIQQELQIASLRAQLEENQRQSGTYTDRLSFLAGAPVGELEFKDWVVLLSSRELSGYLSTLELRPDVRAAQESVDLSKGLIRIAVTDYWPRLDLAADYYAYRPDSKKNINWDAALVLNMPLWNWGARSANLDVVKSALAQKNAVLSMARRQSELEIKNAYRNYVSSKKEFEYLKNVLDLARQDYDLQVRDDRRGLVTSLEVVESLNRLNNAERAVNNGLLSIRLTAIELQLVSGAVPEEILP